MQVLPVLSHVAAEIIQTLRPGVSPNVHFEPLFDFEHGHLVSDVCRRLSEQTKDRADDLAQQLAAAPQWPGSLLVSAGGGFINVRFRDDDGRFEELEDCSKEQSQPFVVVVAGSDGLSQAQRARLLSAAEMHRRLFLLAGMHVTLYVGAVGFGKVTADQLCSDLDITSLPELAHFENGTRVFVWCDRFFSQAARYIGWKNEQPRLDIQARGGDPEWLADLDLFLPSSLPESALVQLAAPDSGTELDYHVLSEPVWLDLTWWIAETERRLLSAQAPGYKPLVPALTSFVDTMVRVKFLACYIRIAAERGELHRFFVLVRETLRSINTFLNEPRLRAAVNRREVLEAVRWLSVWSRSSVGRSF